MAKSDNSIFNSLSSVASGITQGISGAASGAFAGIHDTLSKAMVGTIAVFTPKPGIPIEEVIGPSIPGASILGDPRVKACENVPSRFLKEGVNLFLHELGLRIQPQKGEPLLIPKEQMINAQKKYEKTKKTSSSPGITALSVASGAVLGGLFFGPVGDGTTTTITESYAIDLSFTNEDGLISRLVILSTKEAVLGFSKQLSDFLNVKPKKKFGLW